MFADTVLSSLNSGFLAEKPLTKAFIEGLLKNSQKFVFENALAPLLENVFSNWQDKGLPQAERKFLRLPYTVTWIESPPQWETHTAKLGFLMLEQFDKLTGIVIWQQPDGLIQTFPFVMLTDLQMADLGDFELPIKFTCFPDDEYHNTSSVHKKIKPTKQDLEHGNSMMQMLLIHLYVLNSKNLIVKTDIPLSEKLQKSRIKRGRLPLYEHKLCRLDLSKKQNTYFIQNGSSKADIRAHLVRGHFKCRKSGIYWWSPFARGNAKAGIIEKDYEVLE